MQVSLSMCDFLVDTRQQRVKRITEAHTSLANICSKLIIETLEQDVKFVQS